MARKKKSKYALSEHGNIIAEVHQGNTKTVYTKKEMARCGAYSLGNRMKVTYLPLKLSEYAKLRKMKKR